MRESIANSYIFTLVIIFVSIIIVILIGSISYSKTFKIKNRLIDTIELNQGWSETDTAGKESVRTQFEKVLRDAGYRVASSYGNVSNTGRLNCPRYRGTNAIFDGTKNGDYPYCVYEISTEKGKYYHGVVFMSFDIPIIGNFLVFSLGGDTRIIYDL